MGLSLVNAGRNLPDEVNVIIEIPKDSEPVKYEVDVTSGAMFVDRILTTPMRYPCNYGYIPRTLADDGDAVDVCVILPLPVVPGSVVRCRPVGMLRMKDEAGMDAKVIAVPMPDVFDGYAHVTDIEQVSPHWLERIGHFFKHYKDLEDGKWVEIGGWLGAEAARQEIAESIKRYEDTPAHLKPPAG